MALETPLRDLGLDSLAAVSLILDLEDEFDVTLPDSSLVAGTFRTPRTLWAAMAAETGLIPAGPAEAGLSRSGLGQEAASVIVDPPARGLEHRPN